VVSWSSWGLHVCCMSGTWSWEPLCPRLCLLRLSLAAPERGPLAALWETHWRPRRWPTKHNSAMMTRGIFIPHSASADMATIPTLPIPHCTGHSRVTSNQPRDYPQPYAWFPPRVLSAVTLVSPRVDPTLQGTTMTMVSSVPECWGENNRDISCSIMLQLH
jgi:hypothetical protein